MTLFAEVRDGVGDLLLHEEKSVNYSTCLSTW